ncbi:MAG: 2Fe-2S iron-sulfur cluster-binding protein [Chitinophagaceae bacterium]|uniref:2Fe-2S iron-sulfur cluster-binding protein n=1 Tax=Rurimicrobium arvi TaxID=2049916 RepID=A0ABP8MHE1_9BACT
MALIKFKVEDRDGSVQELEIPDDMSLSLMEALKASEYHILATCGGMALCATCHVQVMEGFDNLPISNSDELDMLDTLPDVTDISRLACQLRINEKLSGAYFKIVGATEE